jgi:membrane protein
MNSRAKALRIWGTELWGLAERSARRFVRHDMVLYAMALAYRGLFALFPFAIFLVAVISFLRVDVVLEWLAEQGPPGIQGRVPQPVESLLGQVLGQDQGALLAAGIVLAFWSVSVGARLLSKALNAVLEIEETRPLWKRVASSLTFAPGLAFAGITAVALMLLTSRAAAWLAGLVSLDEAFVLL